MTTFSEVFEESEQALLLTIDENGSIIMRVNKLSLYELYGVLLIVTEQVHQSIEEKFR